jgi:polygalacturonase
MFNMCLVLFKLFILIYFFDPISTQDFHVLDFGAVGDGVTNDTKAVRGALAAANNSNGGRVIFDFGYKFLTGPFNITSNVILDVRGTIIASSNRTDYFSILEVPW